MDKPVTDPAERDRLALVAVSAWLNVTPEQLPEKYKVHTCAASMEAWARVAEAMQAELRAELAAMRERAEGLAEALSRVLEACNQGRMVERGAGGMTIEAQIRRSVINGVPAWPVEEARAALAAWRGE